RQPRRGLGHRRRVHAQPLDRREGVLRRVPHQRAGRGRRGGIRTPRPIAEMPQWNARVYAQLDQVRKTLQKQHRETQDIEFTIQKGRLWMLQTRTGKRTGFAAVRVAVDMVEERLIRDVDALKRIDPESLNQLLRPVFDADAKAQALKEHRLLGKGL